MTKVGKTAAGRVITLLLLTQPHRGWSVGNSEHVERITSSEAALALIATLDAAFLLGLTRAMLVAACVCHSVLLSELMCAARVGLAAAHAAQFAPRYCRVMRAN